MLIVSKATFLLSLWQNEKRWLIQFVVLWCLKKCGTFGKCQKNVSHAQTFTTFILPKRRSLPRTSLQRTLSWIDGHSAARPMQNSLLNKDLQKGFAKRKEGESENGYMQLAMYCHEVAPSYAADYSLNGSGNCLLIRT